MTPIWYPDSVTTDLSRGIHYTLLWGLEGVVLRFIGGAEHRVPFVNEEKLKRRLHEAELPIVAVDPGLFEGSYSNKASWMNERMILEDVAAFCQRVNAPAIVVGALGGDDEYKLVEVADALQNAGDVATRHGVKLVVFNDAESVCATGIALSELLKQVNHPSIEAYWRPCEDLKRGEAVVVGLEAFVTNGVKLGLVEAANGHNQSGDWIDTSLEDGEIDWSSLIHRLHNSGYSGPIALKVTEQPAAKAGLSDASTLISAIRKKTASPTN